MAAAPSRAMSSRTSKKCSGTAVFAKPAVPLAVAKHTRRTAVMGAPNGASLVAGKAIGNAKEPQQHPRPGTAVAPVPAPSRPLGEVAPEWYKTYRKAFPSFVFYFHDVDDKNIRIFTRFTLLLGGIIEPFFSKKVTHLITGGPIPANYTMSKQPSYQQQPPQELSAPRMTAQGPSSSRNSVDHGLPAEQRLLHGRGQGNRRASEDKENRPKRPVLGRHVIGSTQRSPLRRSFRTALRSKIPVSSKENIVTQSCVPSPKPDIAAKAVEMKIKIWGIEKYTKVLSALMNPSSFDDSARPSLRITLRDEKILGPAAVYRPMQDYYILSEDATGVYRPMVVREYVPTAKDREPWPRLRPREKAECPFSRPDDRSDSQAAVRTEGFRQKKFGAARDRAVGNQLNPGATAAPRVSLTRRTMGKEARENAPAQAPSVNASGIIAGGSGVSAANAVTSVQLTGPETATKEAQQGKIDQLVGKTVSVLQRPKDRFKKPPAPSKLATVQNMVKLEAKQTADIKLPRKSGFCENCYTKFDDMEKHIRSKTHREFATNHENFGQLAALVDSVARLPRLRAEFEEGKEEAEKSDGFGEPRTCQNFYKGVADS